MEDLRLQRAVGAVERHSVWALSALLALSGALLMYMGRGLSFYYDEWEWVVNDYYGGTHWLLVAHVGNISVFPAALYRLLFHLVGLDHYAVFRLDVTVLHLIGGALVYVLAARRIPRVPALLAAALILFLGAAWEDLLWAFQVGYLLSVAGGLATWTLLERRRGRFNDLAAMLCLLVAAGSSSLGIPVMAGVAVELARRRPQRRRLWIVAIPAALYVLWYETNGASQVTAEGLIHAPGYAAELAAAALGGLVGHGLDWGQPLAVAGLLILLYCLARPAPISARLSGLLTAAAVLWAITAAARSTISPPESSRYIYLGAVLIVLIGVELLRGVTITPRMSALATVVVGFCALTGVTLLHSGAIGLRTTSRTVTAEIGALEIAAAYAPGAYQPDPVHAPPVFAGPYLRAVRSIGSSPADTPAEILASAPSARAAADGVLLALEAPRPRPLGTTPLPALAPAPALASLGHAAQSPHAECVRLTQLPGPPMTATLALPAAGLLIRDEGPAPTALALKRFGEGFTALPASVAAHSAEVLAVPADHAAHVPWQLQLASSSPLSLCSL